MKMQRFLVVRYDVTGWSESEVSCLAGEAIAQGEPSDPYSDDPDDTGHPNARTTSAIVGRLAGHHDGCDCVPCTEYELACAAMEDL